MDGRHGEVSVQSAEQVQAGLLSPPLHGARSGDAALALQLLRLQAHQGMHTQLKP